MPTVREQILSDIKTKLEAETWTGSVYRGMINFADAVSDKYDYPLVSFYELEEDVIEGAYKEIRCILTLAFEIYEKTSEDNQYVDIRANELLGYFVDFIYNNARWSGNAENSTISNNVIGFKEGDEKFFVIVVEVKVEYSYVRGNSGVKYGG